MLEICPTPNPTLNRPDSVDKWKTEIKTHLLMQPCYFELSYKQIWTVFSNHGYTRVEPELLASQVRIRTPWATEPTIHVKDYKFYFKCLI